MNVKDIYFFGDFSNNQSLRSEMPRIRGVSNKIIETGNASSHVTKDFTDFIMLDHIYQEAMQDRDKTDIFIIFTGDGHFTSVTSFLKNICKKEVGIYAVKGGLSNQLKMTASWVKEYPDEEDKMKEIFQLIFTSLYRIEKSPNAKKLRPTFVKTVDAVSAHNRLPKGEVRKASQWLIDNGYIEKKKEKAFGKTIVTLSANWFKVAKDGLWVQENDKFSGRS